MRDLSLETVVPPGVREDDFFAVFTTYRTVPITSIQLYSDTLQLSCYLDLDIVTLFSHLVFFLCVYECKK